MSYIRSNQEHLIQVKQYQSKQNNEIKEPLLDKEYYIEQQI